MPRTLSLWAIPAETRAAKCKGCGATGYWITTGKGKPLLISTDVEGGKAPTTEEPGQGHAHYATCPAAAQFRQARR